MHTPPYLGATIRHCLLLLILATSITGCEIWRGGVSATPLTRTADQPEEGWVYAQGADVRAACPTSWTLEMSEHRTRAWRCRYPDALDGPFACGLTIYGKRGAKNLDQLAESYQPDIEAYGDGSELLSSERTTLGDKPSQLFVLDQVFGEAQARGLYHLVYRDDGAWLAHCVVPRDKADQEAEQISEIFSRIQL